MNGRLVARWDGRISLLRRGEVTEKGEPLARFVGIPGMNAVCKRLATNLRVKHSCEVASVGHADNAWRLLDLEAKPLGTF